jgi:hypothetical protein
VDAVELAPLRLALVARAVRTQAPLVMSQPVHVCVTHGQVTRFLQEQPCVAGASSCAPRVCSPQASAPVLRVLAALNAQLPTSPAPPVHLRAPAAWDSSTRESMRVCACAWTSSVAVWYGRLPMSYEHLHQRIAAIQAAAVWAAAAQTGATIEGAHTGVEPPTHTPTAAATCGDAAILAPSLGTMDAADSVDCSVLRLCWAHISREALSLLVHSPSIEESC